MKYQIERSERNVNRRKIVELRLNQFKAGCLKSICGSFRIYFQQQTKDGYWIGMSSQITSPEYKSMHKAEKYAERKLKQLAKKSTKKKR